MTSKNQNPYQSPSPLEGESNPPAIAWQWSWFLLPILLIPVARIVCLLWYQGDSQAIGNWPLLAVVVAWLWTDFLIARSRASDKACRDVAWTLHLTLIGVAIASSFIKFD